MDRVRGRGEVGNNRGKCRDICRTCSRVSSVCSNFLSTSRIVDRVETTKVSSEVSEFVKSRDGILLHIISKSRGPDLNTPVLFRMLTF